VNQIPLDCESDFTVLVKPVAACARRPAPSFAQVLRKASSFSGLRRQKAQSRLRLAHFLQ
jgi:hypothetical protein